MKKTFQVNVNGKVFHIDEDAYELLLTYMNQLHNSFSRPEADEIVGDIEARISELFDERISSGAYVINYADVNRVIEIMGKPSDISENNEPEDERSETTANLRNETKIETQPQKKLYRNVKNKVFGGVLGGLSAYLGWDANIMRLLYTVLALVTYFWPLTIVYLIAWMVIPPANNPRRILELQGEPVTVDSVSQTVLSSSAATPPPYPGKQSTGIIETIFGIIGKCIMSLLGMAGTVGGLVATGFILFFIVALVAAIFFGDTTLIETYSYRYSFDYSYALPVVVCLFGICLSSCFIIPSVALIWCAACSLFNVRSASKTTIITAALLETFIIVATIVFYIFSEQLSY